jgi:hypothetical protein
MGDASEPDRIASRIRCDMNQADLRVTPMVRESWLLDMPFLEEAIIKMATSQSRILIWLDSKIVPILTVNGFRQT